MRNPAMILSDIRQEAHRLLHVGVRDRTHAFHTPAIATADADARVMVLRAFDEAAWTLRFHTDARAPKADAIGRAAPVGVLFYDAGEGVQLRARGTGRIVTRGEAVDAAWRAADNYARRCYLGAAPGEVSPMPASGLPEWVEGEKPTDDQLAPARGNFALLTVTIDRIDWYRLAHDGHRRVLLTRTGDSWLTP